MSRVSKKMAIKRSRHFHHVPETAGEAEDARAVRAPATAACLYRHALESIFAFLSLAQLGRVLAVSRSWRSAVSSMRCIDATVESLPIGDSRLARHIGTLGSSDARFAARQTDLHLASLCMSGLHTLCCDMLGPTDDNLLFPPSLTHLAVRVPDNATSTKINKLIVAISQIPKLNSLLLQLQCLHSTVSFAPFRRGPLRELELQLDMLHRLFERTLTQAQADDVRAMPNLTHIHLPFYIGDLRMLLRAPHEL